MLSLVLITLLSNFPNTEVRKVHDGDTFTVDLPEYAPVFGSAIPVRILGIDTAEITDKKPCVKADAEDARKKLADMVLGKSVDLVGCSRDKFFRIDCKVYLQGADVGQKLLSLKLARPYHGEAKVSWVCRR